MEKGGERKRGTVEEGGGERYQRGGSKPARLVLTSKGKGDESREAAIMAPKLQNEIRFNHCSKMFKGK